MATDSVLGIFADPYQYMQQKLQGSSANALKYAEMDPMARAQYGIYKGASQLGTGVAGLLGVEDPQMQLMTMRKQLAQGKDLATSEGWTNYAKELQAQGDVQGAAQASQRALEVRNTESQILGRTEEKQAQREMQLQIAREKIQGTIEAARERGATALQIAQMQQEGRMQLAQIAASLKSGKEPTVDDKAAVRIGQNTTFDSLINEGEALKSDIDANKDAFTLSGRGTTAFKSVFNPDAPEVKVKSDVDAYMNKARNAYLLAAKGTQTEGDAQRAWAEFSGSLDFSSASGAKRSVERIKKELETQKAANEAYLSSRGIRQQGQPTRTSFGSVDEAMKANLPKGTVITINGRRAVVE